MAIRLEITSKHKKLLGDDCERSFGAEGGTIGRSLKNDWILPDTERFISGRHATVDYQAGSYYLADTSTNGVFVNGEVEPIGKGNPRRLFNGDTIRMGNFEMHVHLDEGEDLEMPPDPAPSVVPDHMEQLVAFDDTPSSMMLLDEEEIAGANVFSSLTADSGNSAIASMADPMEHEPAPSRSGTAAPVVNPATPDKSPMRENPDEQDNAALLDRFLRAAGIDPDDLHPSTDAAAVLENAGRLLNEFVLGVTSMLIARSNVKSMFRLDQTTVLPRHNNPLKLSADTADSLRQLLIGREGDYLGGLDSIREACRDLRYHHDAIVGSVIQAFDEYISRFSPDALEENFSNEDEGGSLLARLQRKKYWDRYRDVFPIMTEKGNASLPVQFAEDFVRHYERQLADARRREVALGDTQRLDRRTAVDPASRGRAPGANAASAARHQRDAGGKRRTG